MQKDKDMKECLNRAFRKYPPEQNGGCFQATRWILKNCSKHFPGGLKEARLKIRNKCGDVTHCVAVDDKGNIIDTQYQQFGLILPNIPFGSRKCVFTKEEHEKMLPRYEIGQ